MSCPPGYFRLSRKMFDGGDDFWTEKRVYSRAEAWIDLLAMASWRPRVQSIKGVLIPLGRGQLLASLRFLGARWQWSKGKVERFLETLETRGRVERKPDHAAGHLGPVLTISNYDAYQGSQAEDGTADGTVTGHRRDSDGTVTGQRERSKEGERSKEQKERTLFPAAAVGDGPRSKDEPLPLLPSDLAAIPGMPEAWEERLRERKAKKSRGKQTPHQVAGLFKLLRRVVEVRGPGHALFCVQRATGNGDQGVVFEKDLEASKNGSGKWGPAPDIRRTAGAPGTDYGPGAFDPERGIVS
jgi:hypothetical protein